jgi:hypothetical protein
MPVRRLTQQSHGDENGQYGAQRNLQHRAQEQVPLGVPRKLLSAGIDRMVTLSGHGGSCPVAIASA